MSVRVTRSFKLVRRKGNSASANQPKKDNPSGANTNPESGIPVVNPITVWLATIVCLANQQGFFGIILMNMMQQQVTPFDCQTAIPQGRIVVCDRRSCV